MASDGRIQCDLCPRACRLRDGQRGMCFVRARRGNQMVLETWGRSSGFCVDPIEKKPLNHFLPGTPVLSFGTAGCNLACKFCQNWDISKSRQMDTLQDQASPEALVAAAVDAGARSIAFTYNDPVIFLEYALDVAVVAREAGINSVAVSAGYISEAPRREFFGAMQAANIDLKAFSERFYQRICGGHLADVLETIEYVHHGTDVWLELTTLLIPGENDSDAEIDAMTRWLVDHVGPEVPLHFTAFHPDHVMRETPRTPASTLTHARQIAMANGLDYVYTGNVHDPIGGATVCPRCHSVCIGRDWYQLGTWAITMKSEGNMAGGVCKHCGEPIPGVFEHQPGDWGARREPVNIGRVS
ncbi:MAG: AmmeMemoRadiSam system radical SAM enzyme [Pseudomonadota bacterium]